MSHTNQTANYHLPQFIGTDKPAWLVDVNQAYADIDTQMKANETASATAEADAQSALSGVTALNSQVGALQTSVTTLETQAPLDEAQIETNRQNIATNAQNIVDLDNRMGHTSISGIGDGSATGAIKAVDDKVGDLADLDTTDKSSIVDAINEVVAGGGGDTSTVRYNNGWIEYTDDGGTTWHQLINVSTPNQIFPVMSSSSSSIGTFTAHVGGSTSPLQAEAYKIVDGSGSSSVNYLRVGNGAGYCAFEFNEPTFVKSTSLYASCDSADSGLVKVKFDVKKNGSWIEVDEVTITSVLTQYYGTINDTVDGLRIRPDYSAMNCYQWECWN